MGENEKNLNEIRRQKQREKKIKIEEAGDSENGVDDRGVDKSSATIYTEEMRELKRRTRRQFR